MSRKQVISDENPTLNTTAATALPVTAESKRRLIYPVGDNTL
ncbi:MAG: hypothetical protein WA941_21160 [Nitrososphaeraceae archaeon]